MMALCLIGRADTWFQNQSVVDSLKFAHQNFLTNHFKEMAENIRDVLKDKNADENQKKNALALLEKTYTSRSGSAIPVDWKLPTELKKLKISVRHGRHNQEADNYRIVVAGTLQEKGIIRDLRITRYPDVVMLDKGKKMGEWIETIDPDEGPSYEFEGPEHNQPIPEGLYLLDIELANGKTTQGWVILNNLLASETPKLTVPALGQTFTTANPVMKFEDFRSPEYQSFEQRGLWLGVARFNPPDYKYDEVWSYYEQHPNRTEATIGAEPGSVGASKLENGKYYFIVSFKESRRFGDIRLDRQAVTAYPFFVKVK